MSLRFGLGTLFAVAGGFLVVSSLAFATPTAAWLAFGVSTAVAAMAIAALAVKGASSKTVGYAGAALVGGWSLIAALIFSGDVLMWLIFADALALVAVALADLALHEVGTERVVHTLDVRDSAKVVQAA